MKLIAAVLLTLSTAVSFPADAQELRTTAEQVAPEPGPARNQDIAPRRANFPKSSQDSVVGGGPGPDAPRPEPRPDPRPDPRPEPPTPPSPSPSPKPCPGRCPAIRMDPNRPDLTNPGQLDHQVPDGLRDR